MLHFSVLTENLLDKTNDEETQQLNITYNGAPLVSERTSNIPVINQLAETVVLNNRDHVPTILRSGL